MPPGVADHKPIVATDSRCSGILSEALSPEEGVSTFRRQVAHQRRGAADCGEHRQAAGVIASRWLWLAENLSSGVRFLVVLYVFYGDPSHKARKSDEADRDHVMAVPPLMHSTSHARSDD
jgi:hypothetical protein